MKLITILLLFAFVVFSSSCAQESQQKENTQEVEEKMIDNINNISVKDMDGGDVNLSDYNGKVLLIVNVASECGYTPQYKGLQELYSEYRDKGLEILAFPCNDFGSQEPGTNEEIKNFCSSNFGVTFKLFDKIKVLGEDKEPLYAKLTNNDVVEKGDIKWNFEKFLISKKGEIVARYRSAVEPLSETILNDIDKEIGS